MRTITFMLVLVSLTMKLYSQNNAANYVKNLQTDKNAPYSGFKGSSSVNASGGFNYDIPIAVTPGVAGISPQLSVSYNSFGPTSILGNGWSLNGLSIITRAPDIRAIDGKTKPISYSEDDKLMLDGQRLVLVNPTDRYGDAQTEYRTENNSYKRIVIQQVNGDRINGIAYITVETKDGLIYKYGKGYESDLPRQEGIVTTTTIKRAGIVLPMIWLLTEIRDKNDNWISFNYQISANSYRPAQITYGASKNTRPTGKVIFTYYDPDVYNWDVQKYIQGEKIVISQPLRTISTIFVKNGNKESQVRNYNFVYSKTPNDYTLLKISQSVKQSIDSKAYDDSPNSILFDWKKAQPDAVLRTNITTSKDESVKLEEDYKIAMGDFNGDGYPDELMYKNYGDKLKLFLFINDKHGKFSLAGNGQTIATALPKTSKVFTGDFNADGRNDLIFLTNDQNTLSIHCYSPKVAAGNDFVEFAELSKANVTNLPAIDLKKIYFGIGDLNSDGYSDILLYYIDNAKLNYEPIIFSNNFQITATPLKNIDKGEIPDDSFFSQMADINDDGITDIIFSWTNSTGWYAKSMIFNDSKLLDLKTDDPVKNTSINKTLEKSVYTLTATPQVRDTIYKASSTITQGDFTDLKNIMLADVNKDGNLDIVISNTSKDGWIYYCALGKGNGQFDFTTGTILKRPFLYNYKTSFGDFNGDGFTDLIIQFSDNKGWHSLVSYGDGKGNFAKIDDNKAFDLLSDQNFSYSHSYETINVFPFGGPEVYGGFHEITSNPRFASALPCNDANELCMMRDIRMIFPVETGFYPSNNRVFTKVIRYPYTDVIPQTQNAENNVKRIVDVDFFGRQMESFRIEAGFIFPSGLTRVTFGDFWQPYVIDLNGDGISDILLTYPIQPPTDANLGQPQNPLDNNFAIVCAINTSEKSGFVQKISQSDKSVINVKYASILTNKMAGGTPGTLLYPYLALTFPVYTVSEISQSTGIGVNSLSSKLYYFDNGIVALNGRGFLGFAISKVVDEVTKNEMSKEFYTDKSYLDAGVLLAEKTKVIVSQKVVSEENYQYQILKKANQAFFGIFNTKKTVVSTDLGGIRTNYTESTYTYDENGNLITSDIKRGLFGDEEITERTINHYKDTAGNEWNKNWLLGRLETSTVTWKRNNITYPSRTAEFDYDPNTGQMTNEISNKQDKAHSLTKIYNYNAYGNIEKSISYPTSHFTPDSTKTVITSYTEDQRFVTNMTDPEGYITTKEFEPVEGLLRTVTFAEKTNITSITSDPLGTTIGQTTPDKVSSATEYRICTDCDLKTKAGYFSIKSDNSSNSPVITYYDNKGRQIRQVSFDFKDRQVNADQVFDRRGNLIKTSLPYFNGQTPHFTQYEYDDLNRIIKTTLPNNSVVIHKYSGLSDTVINAKSQKVITQRNILGEVVTSTDDAGYYLNYKYDAFGRVTTITDKNGLQYKFEYDVLGNRTGYWNPNFQGKEVTIYNAFNQKVYSRDAAGNEKEYRYDKLDRILKLIAKEGERPDIIEYDYIKQSDNLPGKGKVKSIKSFSDDHPMDELFEYYPNGQLKVHTYNYFSFNDRLGTRHNNIFLYDDNSSKANSLKYTYKYDKNQVASISYPYSGKRNDRKFSVQYTYTNGHLTKATGLTDANPKGFNLWELINTNAFGLTTNYKLGDKLVANQKYNPLKLTLESLSYQNAGGEIAGMKYGYDTLGNMNYRQDLKNTSLRDSIYYDNLNRIISVKTNAYTVNVEYNENGGIKKKTFGNERELGFTYRTSNYEIDKIEYKNLITATAFRPKTMSYDANGNETSTLPYLISEKSDRIAYNQFNQAAAIFDSDGNEALKFYYGFDNRKDAFYDYKNHTGSALLGNLSEYVYQFNKHDKGGDLLYQKINIRIEGNTVATIRTDNNQLKFLLRDAGGTIIATADVNGNLGEYYNYDVWGLKRTALWKYDWNSIGADGSNSDQAFLYKISFADYGLNDFGSRLYDPITGRFINVDEVLTNKFSNTQFTNPYIYALNNPTVFRDGNGKFPFLVVAIVAAYLGASATGGSLLPWEWNSNWWKGALVGLASAAGGYAAAPSLFTAGAGTSLGAAMASGAAAGFAGGFTATLVNGGNFSQALENGFKSGLVGGLSGGVTYGIGSAFGNPNAMSTDYFAKAAAHGVNQGLVSEALGGSFEHGFLAGSAVSLGQPGINQAHTEEERVVVAALVGGTSSQLGGGKFANGAVSGAMEQLYNDEQHREEAKKREQANFVFEIHSEGAEFVEEASKLKRYGDPDSEIFGEYSKGFEQGARAFGYALSTGEFVLNVSTHEYYDATWNLIDVGTTMLEFNPYVKGVIEMFKAQSTAGPEYDMPSQQDYENMKNQNQMKMP